MPQHRNLIIFALEHRARGDRQFARDERGVIWRTFKPQGGYGCVLPGIRHQEVWMHDFGNTRIYTCEHEATVTRGPAIKVYEPRGR